MKKEIAIEHATRFLFPFNNSLVTCVDHTGRPNIIGIGLFGKAWGKPCDKSDPGFGVYWIMVHPHRYSHALIEEIGEFVINIATVDIAEETWYCGTRSGRKFDKFKETGLTPVPAKHVSPPLIKECPINIECRVVEKVKPRCCKYTYFFGKALAVHVEEGVWDGNILNLDKCHVTFALLAERLSESQFIAPGKIVLKGGKAVRD